MFFPDAPRARRRLFRSTKRVTEMRISFERELSGAKSHSIVFRMGCVGHMTKTHRFSVEECQILQAVFDKTQAPNNITTRVRQLSRVATTRDAAIGAAATVVVVTIAASTTAAIVAALCCSSRAAAAIAPVLTHQHRTGSNRR